jgi:hypothetical protein
MINTILFLGTLFSISNPHFEAGDISVENKTESYFVENNQDVLAKKSISLENRNSNKFVNDVFKDNILLTLNYMTETVKNKSEIDWEEVGRPRFYQFSLKPGESFAFHEQMQSAYISSVVKTTNAHFNYQDGFKSDGYLMGDGVCHLASLLYWASKDAGLTTQAPTDHDFAKINEVPKEYGVSIFYLPNGFEKSTRQNLYITNSLDNPIFFIFNFDGKDLSIKIVKSDLEIGS